MNLAGIRPLLWLGFTVTAVATLSNPEEAFSFLQMAVLTVGGPLLAAAIEGHYSLERQRLENDGSLRRAALLHFQEDEDDDEEDED